jgi:6-phosphogluconolactonase
VTAGAPPELVRAPSAAALADAAATRLADAAHAAVAARGRFTLALAGGGTPRDSYTRLAGLRERVPWGHVDLYFGDERCVPPSDDRSNFRMVAGALLDHVPIAPHHVHRMHGELAPDEGAAAYERTLRGAFGDVAARAVAVTFDVALLGVGTDGHTASLFPGGLALRERERWAVAVPPPTAVEPRVGRITLTLPVLCRAREVWFLCSGRTKRDIVGAILADAPAAREWPAAMVRGAERTLWLVDDDAAPIA